MRNTPRASFEIVQVTDTLVLLYDRDEGRTVTNDAEAVVEAVSERLGGIGRRRVYYRDTDGYFNELVVRKERFASFRACPPGQQQTFANMLSSVCVA